MKSRGGWILASPLVVVVLGGMAHPVTMMGMDMVRMVGGDKEEGRAVGQEGEGGRGTDRDEHQDVADGDCKVDDGSDLVVG